MKEYVVGGIGFDKRTEKVGKHAETYFTERGVSAGAAKIAAKGIEAFVRYVFNNPDGGKYKDVMFE